MGVQGIKGEGGHFIIGNIFFSRGFDFRFFLKKLKR